MPNHPLNRTSLLAAAAFAVLALAGLGPLTGASSPADAAAVPAPIHQDAPFTPEALAGLPTSSEILADSQADVVDGDAFVCAAGPGQGRFQLVVAQPRLEALGVVNDMSESDVATTATIGVGTSLGPFWQASFEAAATVLLRESASRGDPARFRVACDNGVPSVLVIEVPARGTPTGLQAFNDVNAALPNDPNTKFMALYNGMANCGCNGLGNMPADDRRTSSNAANTGGQVGLTILGNIDPANLEYAYLTLLHEATHNMGAVQSSAPHASGGGHCNDGHDIMCYHDSGSRSAYSEAHCPVSAVRVGVETRNVVRPVAPLDCNGDDYFNPHPPAGSYLCSHWNVGSRLNRFLQFDAPYVVLPGACY